MSVILCAAVAFASRSLEYMRFPDTEQIRGLSLFTSAVSNGGLVWRYFVIFGDLMRTSWGVALPLPGLFSTDYAVPNLLLALLIV